MKNRRKLRIAIPLVLTAFLLTTMACHGNFCRYPSSHLARFICSLLDHDDKQDCKGCKDEQNGKTGKGKGGKGKGKGGPAD